MPQRTLSEAEFTAIKQKVLAAAPAGLDEDSFNRWAGPRMAAAIGTAESLPVAPAGSSLGRFAEGVWQMVNPVSLAEGLYGAVRHPVKTAVKVGKAQYEQGKQAFDLAKQGRYVEAAGHGVAAALPLIGPAAAEAGEQIAAGDIAGGLGKGVGLAAPFAASPALKAGVRAVRASAPGAATAVAEGLASKAGEMVADVATPKVGPNKLRFGNQARELAPDLLKRGEAGAWTREGLHSTVKQGLATAEDALDAAADSRNAGFPHDTKGIVKALLDKRQELTAEAFDATEPARTATTRTSAILDASGKPAQVTDLKATPIGRDVVPGPNAERVAQIDKAISELKQLGPQAPYESLRRIRQAYDGPAKATYAPSVTADYLKAQGGKLGAADVTGTIRSALAEADPATAATNAEYHLYRTLDEVLSAAKETEAARPKIGRRMAAILFGGGSGAAAGGATGATAGAALFLAVDAAASAGWTTKLKAAQLMTDAAKALRSGSEGQLQSVAFQLRKLGTVGAVQAGRLTSPTESQIQPEPVR